MITQNDIDIIALIVPATTEQATALDRVKTHAMRAFLVDNQAATWAMYLLRTKGGDPVQTDQNHKIADTIQALLSKADALEAEIEALTHLAAP